MYLLILECGRICFTETITGEDLKNSDDGVMDIIFLGKKSDKPTILINGEWKLLEKL